jgi:cytochrome c oxidase subunit I
MVAVTVLSAVVYGYHMFVTGMSPLLGQGFMLLTLIISVPAEILFLNWLHTLWKGSIRLTTPMLFALGTIFVFGLGGLTGIFLGTITTDLYLHDTMFVVGHFHFTMAAASFLASFAAIYFWFPKMFGKLMDERLGKIHFWSSVVLITAVFAGQLIAGYSGQQRRLYDPFQYTFIQHLRGLNRWTSYFAFALFVGQLAFIWNFFRTVFGPAQRVPQNPWQVGTLEWTDAPSPPPHHNYDVVPTVVRGPHEFANPEVAARLGRDWIGQAEPLPATPRSAHPAAATAGEQA